MVAMAPYASSSAAAHALSNAGVHQLGDNDVVLYCATEGANVWDARNTDSVDSGPRREPPACCSSCKGPLRSGKAARGARRCGCSSFLHVAAAYGHATLVRELVALGADVDATTHDGWESALVAATGQKVKVLSRELLSWLETRLYFTSIKFLYCAS